MGWPHQFPAEEVKVKAASTDFGKSPNPYSLQANSELPNLLCVLSTLCLLLE